MEQRDAQKEEGSSDGRVGLGSVWVSQVKRQRKRCGWRERVPGEMVAAELLLLGFCCRVGACPTS